MKIPTSVTMLLNYLKLSLRLLIRNPFFTLINVVGLSVGFSLFLILWPYSTYELKSEQFHTDYQRISDSTVTFAFIRVLTGPTITLEHSPLYSQASRKGSLPKSRALHAQYADKALEMARIIEPQFSRHKTVGLVRTDKETLDKPTKIEGG